MTNRRDFLVKFTMAAGAAAVLRPLNAFAGMGTSQLPATNTLTILHTANFNGQWSALGSNEKMPGFGGFQNINKKIKEIKSSAASVLLIHTGNITHTPSSLQENGLPFYKALSKPGYDIVLPGPSDLAKGIDSFMQLANESGLPIFPFQNGASYGTGLLPHHILKKGHCRIGIINAATALHNRPALSSSAVNHTAILLREAKQCAVVICLVPVTGSRCLQLAEGSSGVDVILTAMEKQSIHNMEIVRNKTGGEVILSYAGSKGTMMSRMDLTFNDRQEKIAFASEPVFIGMAEEAYTGMMKRYHLGYA